MYYILCLSKDNAMEDDIPLVEHKIADRTCLRCFVLFVSAWEGNRICNACKRSYFYKIDKQLVEREHNVSGLDGNISKISE